MAARGREREIALEIERRIASERVAEDVSVPILSEIEQIEDEQERFVALDRAMGLIRDLLRNL